MRPVEYSHPWIFFVACGGRYVGCYCSIDLFLVVYIVSFCRAGVAASAPFPNHLSNGPELVDKSERLYELGDFLGKSRFRSTFALSWFCRMLLSSCPPH